MNNKRKNNIKKEILCPKCKQVLTLGNTYNSQKGYMCFNCTKKAGIKTAAPLDTKTLLCPLCNDELTIGNIMFTPTTVICSKCSGKFKQSFLFLPHTKRAVDLGKYKSTLTLTLVIIIIYLITSFPNFMKIDSFFIVWGALIPGRINDLEFWRIITANLLHVSPMHLISNSISIILWGHLLERQIGSKAVFLLMIFSGLMTCLFSYTFNPLGISLGASGIAYGLMLAFIVYVIFITTLKNPAEFKGQMISFLVLMFFQIAYNIQASSTVDIWGHLGGSIAGIIFISGYIIQKHLRANTKKL